MDYNERAAQRRQEDRDLNRALIWVGAAIVLEFLLVLGNKYYINFRTSPESINLALAISAALNGLRWVSLAALAAWVVNQLLRHFALSYFQTQAFDLTGPLVVAGLQYFLRTCIPELSRRMDENLASLTSNCAAMGTALLIAQRGYGPGGAFLYALFGGAGATVAMMCFAGLRREVSLTSCPRCFQGLPINLITAGLMALSLVGFYGLHLS